MDQMPCWPTQHHHTMSMESSYLPGSPREGDSALHMLYTMHNQEVVQRMNGPLDHHFTKHSISHPPPNDLPPQTLRRGLSLFDLDRHTPGELETDPMTLAEQPSPASDASRSTIGSIHGDGAKATNRRIQNRAAQRRFRERRVEQNKVLQAQLSDLNERHQSLTDELSSKLDLITQLQKDNEKLQAEAQTLRQRWQSMILLLQRPKSLQLLSMLIGEEGSGSASDGVVGSGAGGNGNGGIRDLDRYLPCLDALTASTRSGVKADELDGDGC
ncbi:BZIP transcription factor [Penicillium ucsense]|uniref:BZIP transcription factor n=1 Tax=Penicillium ucsense TaxID=2839758 RepID=A0A8J8WGV9_9EURO|nr:BZIP transcription factor [Penicillium ucsense]KAF7733656.1 BZIP transcription factor [Penicillium ucsense]